MSTKSRSKKTIGKRLKGMLRFHRSGSALTVDTHNANRENASITSVPGPSEPFTSAKLSLLSPVSKPSLSASSVVHIPDGSQPELNQQTSASTPAGVQTTTSSEASSSGHPKTSEPAVEPVPLSPKSSPRKDLWQEAREMLSPETKQKIEKMGVGEPKTQSISHQINDLVKISKIKQEECEKKFWRFQVGDHEIIIRDYAVRIVGWLQKIGDIAINFAPPQASLPWAAIKAVMQIPVMEGAQMCALLASVEKIVRIVNRGRVYELVYTQDNTPEDALQILQSALVELYKASLELLANATHLFSKNTAKRTIHAILNPDETSDILSTLAERETDLGYDAQACESRSRAAVDVRLTELLRGLDAPLTRVDQGVCALLERVNEKERLEILEWISAIPYGKHHNGVKEARTPDTCEWLLRHEKFREWEDTSSSVILWLRGTPGTGKTFLTSKVIDHVQSALKSSPNHEGFAFFYCDRTDKTRGQPRFVLQSYVRQLSTVAGKPEDMQIKLRKLCKEARENASDLSFDECKQQLLESLNLYPKTTLVLDALDECDPDSRDLLIKAINFLLSESKRPLKVFISSRPDEDIRLQFLTRPNIEIQAKDNEVDVKTFVNERIVKSKGLESISLSLREDIVKTLLHRSQGMFQWVDLQIKQILKCKSEEAVRSRLGKLPSGLKLAYDEIYSEIKDLEEYDKVLADRAFMWVMCACKPLNSDELTSAIRVNSNRDTVHLGSKITESSLLSLCNNLLVIDSQLKVWRFSHLSVMEYLEANCPSLRRPHSYAAKVCLGLFIETYKQPKSGSIDSLDDKHDHGSKTCNIFDPKYPLSMYVRRHWRTHVQAQKKQDSDPVNGIQVRKDQDVDLLDGLLETFRRILGPLGAFIEEYRDEEYEEYVASVLRFRYPTLDYLSPELCQFLIDSFVYRYYRIKYERHRSSREMERSESCSPATSSVKLPVTLAGPPRILREPVGEVPQRNVETVETVGAVKTYSEQLTAPYTTDIFDFRQKFKPISMPLQSEVPNVSVAIVPETFASLYPRPRRMPDGQLIATCLICLRSFNAETFEGPMRRTHVEQDLQPFVCISKNCSEDFQFFATFRAWNDHMTRIHSPLWIRSLYNKISWKCPLDSCSSKSALYESKDQLTEEHMLKAHVDINEAELRRIADNSGVTQSSPVDFCPYCMFTPEKQPEDQASDVESGRSGKKPESSSMMKRVQFEYSGEEQTSNSRPEGLSDYERTVRCIAGHMRSLALYFANTLIDSEDSDMYATREQGSNEATRGSSLNSTDSMDSSISLGPYHDENPRSDIDDMSGIPPTEADHWEQIFGRKPVLTYEPPDESLL